MRLDDETTLRTYLLIATGFEEDFVGSCLQILRQMGKRVTIVGMTRGETVGAQGGKISPDFSLDEASGQPLPELIILSGGQACSELMTIDPRVHRLVQLALRHGRIVALGRGGENLLSWNIQQDTQFKAQLFFQLGRGKTEFIQDLAKFCKLTD